MVRLSITREKGLVVTIPRGFQPDLIPSIVAEKQDWIEKSLRKVQEAGLKKPAKSLPAELDLAAIPEKWQVVYKPLAKKSATLSMQSRGVLVVEGRVTKPLVRAVIKKWMNQRAWQVLPDWLDRVSRQFKLPYNEVSIRDQRTRWGSCSAQKNISLNQKLLFLPPDLVDYILIHELCHTIEMSHSSRFWKLVGQYIPDYKERRRTLREYERKITW
jgi:predicted metal-dependent hydrolase